VGVIVERRVSRFLTDRFGSVCAPWPTVADPPEADIRKLHGNPLRRCCKGLCCNFFNGIDVREAVSAGYAASFVGCVGRDTMLVI
jgi:hypothetical protein